VRAPMPVIDMVSQITNLAAPLSVEDSVRSYGSVVPISSSWSNSAAVSILSTTAAMASSSRLKGGSAWMTLSVKGMPPSW
jgi:hypothetical protein